MIEKRWKRKLPHFWTFSITSESANCCSTVRAYFGTYIMTTICINLSQHFFKQNIINWIVERLIFIKECVCYINHVVTVKSWILHMKKYKIIHDNANSFFVFPWIVTKKVKFKHMLYLCPMLKLCFKTSQQTVGKV